MRKLRRLGCLLFMAALLFTLIPRLPFMESMDVYASAYDTFINDSRWQNGTAWGNNQQPKLAPSAQWWGCAAYAYDFAKYNFGADNPRAGTAFYDVNEIRAGDVLTVGNQGDGTGHWFCVLERSGNRLYTAEGNYGSRVRIGWYYTISGNKFAEDSRPFTCGYHFGNPEIAATTNKGAEATFVTNETVQLSVSPDAYSYYVLKIYYTPVGGKTSLYWEGQVPAAKSMSFSKPGYYSCTFLGNNAVESKWVGWRVVEATTPTVTVSTQDKTATVNWTDVKANSYYFYILNLDDNTTHFGANNGKWFNTQVKLDDGRYRAYVTAVYSSTIMKSGSCDFTINTAAQNIYSIHYNANGGSGKMADTQVSYGASFQPRANTFTRNCYNFVGWATSPDTKIVTYIALLFTFCGAHARASM